MATKRHEIEGYIKENVWCAENESGNMVWMAYDLRHGNCFECDTYEEAVDDFVANWDNCTENEKNNA